MRTERLPAERSASGMGTDWLIVVITDQLSALIRFRPPAALQMRLRLEMALHATSEWRRAHALIVIDFYNAIMSVHNLSR